MMNVTVIYPGTFDPITLGHEDLVRRASTLFSRVIIGVANNSNKQPLFSLQERVAMVENVLQTYPNVLVMPFSGLLVDFAKQHQAKVIIRGIRHASDSDFELQLAAVNSALDASIETLFLPASNQYSFISSRLVKEVAQMQGNVDDFLHPDVAKKLYHSFSA